MEPYRAFISDRLPRSQLARGFLTQSMFTGAGAVLANLSLSSCRRCRRCKRAPATECPTGCMSVSSSAPCAFW
jgi:hypothetical protein